MLFNSIQFVVFLIIVFAIYWTIPASKRWIILLAASYYFYMSWNVKYVTLILFTTVITYISALIMERQTVERNKKTVLFITCVLCLGVLFVFKYFNFFSETISSFAGLMSIQVHPITLKLILPVGISFYTFQTMSYLIDVYRGEINAEPNLGIYAAFVSFFPQLVAGPIERTGNLLPQIRSNHCFDKEKAIYGSKLMLLGYFKKIVIADNLALYVDSVYADLPEYKGFAMFIATIFFTFQIYCDFSGYSDIARGTAGLLDIDLMKNFKSPYYSLSIKEFWSRWHISLSTWFRDYVYIPLGGNRVSRIKHYMNLLVTFLLSGLWHGASWNFVIWGCMHGLAQIIENACKIHLPIERIQRVLRMALTFCFVSFAWIFFRAQTLQDAIYVIRHMCDGISTPGNYVRHGLELVDISGKHILFCIFAYFVPLSVIDYYGLKNDGDGLTVFEGMRLPMRWFVYILLGLAIVFFSQKGVAAEFVYFQF